MNGPLASLPPPSPHLRACVVVPAKDEAARLPRLVAALADQREHGGQPLPAEAYEVLVLVNNSRDCSMHALAEAARAHPRLRLHAVDVTLAPHEAHVGRARQLLFDAAQGRLLALGRPEALVLTTDADTRVPPDWIVAAESEAVWGVEVVGGRVLLDPAERAALPAGVRRLFLLDIGYRRALEAMRALFVPEPHDPFPRHHQHYGACLAVTAGAYARAGGMPLVRTSEDVALVRAVEAVGGCVRHSYRFRAFTSARSAGRAEGGLADAFAWWAETVARGEPVLVETGVDAERRLAALGLWIQEGRGTPPPTLLSPPEPPPTDRAAPIDRVLADLRQRVARLRAFSADDRRAHALRLTRPIRSFRPAA